jgi:hypothetical protein
MITSKSFLEAGKHISDLRNHNQPVGEGRRTCSREQEKEKYKEANNTRRGYKEKVVGRHLRIGARETKRLRE